MFSMNEGCETLTPRGVANVQLTFPVKAIIPVDKESPEIIRPCARNGLHGRNPILSKDRRVFSE